MQRFGQILVISRIPQNAGPLASGAFVGFCRIGRASDDRRKGVFEVKNLQSAQADSSTSPLDFPPLCGPPDYQAVHRIEVIINRIPISARLAIGPDIAHSLQILSHGF